MRLAQVLLTAALVVAGLVAYDLVRGHAPAEPAPAVDAPLRSPLPAADGRPPPIVIEGSGTEAVLARIERVEAQVGAIQDALSRYRFVAADATTPSPRSGGGAAPRGGVPPFVPPPEYDPSRSSFRPEDLAWFKALREEVDRVDRAERAATFVRAQIGRTGVRLSDENRERVVVLELARRDRVRDVLRSSTGSTAEGRRVALERLTEEFRRDLAAFLAPDEASAIAKELARYPGFGAGVGEEGER